METEGQNCVGKFLEVKKGYNGDFGRKLKILVALLIKNSIIVVTERNEFNRKAKAMNIAAYCRVSTDKSDQLNSLETQKEFFLEYTK